MFSRRSGEDSFGHANHVVPEWLPLVFLVPDVGTLEQRHHQPLRLHEHRLRRTNLSLHESVPSADRHEIIRRMAGCKNV